MFETVPGPEGGHENGGQRFPLDQPSTACPEPRGSERDLLECWNVRSPCYGLQRQVDRKGWGRALMTANILINLLEAAASTEQMFIGSNSVPTTLCKEVRTPNWPPGNSQPGTGQVTMKYERHFRNVGGAALGCLG